MRRFVTKAVRLGFAVPVAVMLSGTLFAGVITIPDSALIPSTTYYTDIIGGGIGSPAIMTGGGNAPGIGGSASDDGFDGPISLGFTLNFFGTNYTEFWANNNGNISFTDGIAEFTPDGPQGAQLPIISPFFADVDSRNAASGVMYVRTDIPNEVIITWDQVGYYSSHADKLNSFQLVLRGPDYNVPAGEGQIGFFYKGMQWETGDASGGSGGFGGAPAAVGFGDGAANGEVLQGSLNNGISGLVNDSHIWFDLNSSGVPVSTNTPEPSTLGLMFAGVAAFGVARWRRKASNRA